MFYNCYNYYNNDLRIGDLVFFKSIILSRDNFVSSIISSAKNSNNIYHVAMIIEAKEDKVSLIDATPIHGVKITSYANLCKTHGFFQDIEVARVNFDANYIQNVIAAAKEMEGLAYNDIFSPNLINSKKQVSFYCSQLVQTAYNDAGAGEVFPDIKMNFLDENGVTLNYWKEYYELKSEKIPQDMPGSHPASLYESNNLIFI